MSNDDETKIQRLQKLLLNRETSKFVFNGLKEITNEQLQTFTDFQNKLEKLYPEERSTPLGNLGKLLIVTVNDNLKNNLVMLLMLETINRNILEDRKIDKTHIPEKDALDFISEYRSTLRFIKRQFEDVAKDTTTE